jgi:hypothetical protein
MPAEQAMVDSQGQSVPMRYVKPYDRKRDALARRCLTRWVKLRAAIARCYVETAADLSAMESLACEERDHCALGVKGNFQFTSFDGLIQVARSARYDLRFDERLRVAQQLIENVIGEKAEGVDEDLAELIKAVFRPTSDGLLSQARVLGLFRLKIKHPRWLEAMDLIRASIESRRGKNLLSVRRKSGRDAEWESILLDIAAVSPSQEKEQSDHDLPPAEGAAAPVRRGRRA